MKGFRPFLIAFVCLVAIPAAVLATIQQQRSQISVTITIEVTPDPLAMQRKPAAADTSASIAGITAHLNLDAVGSPSRRRFSAEALSFSSSRMVAQSQGAVKVEAAVSPNPNGTLLVSNQPGVIIPQTAGTTVVYPCIYTVSVDTTQTSWTLDHGLFSDFAPALGGAVYPGKDVGNNTHLSSATPRPTATPFQVFANDGGVWASVGTGAGAKTYCVDLTVYIPPTTAQGTYSSNAIYTLFY
jgi:hypothetical protein